MKKWFYLVLVVLLVAVVLFLYNAFNGNPVSKFYSKKALENYLSQEYPDREFRTDHGFYDFKFSEYVFDVIEVGSKEGNIDKYEFRVSGFFKPTVNWDGIYYSRLDESLMEKLSRQASEVLMEQIKEKVPSIHGVNVHLEVLKGDYDPETNWDKSVKLRKPMSMHIVLDSTNQTKEDFFEDVKEIQTFLNENGYTYDYVSVNGNLGFEEDSKDQTGYVKYAASFEKDTNLNEKDVKELNQ